MSLSARLEGFRDKLACDKTGRMLELVLCLSDQIAQRTSNVAVSQNEESSSKRQSTTGEDISGSYTC
jgi:hypothetical protein